jgi:uncharacterized protein (TIGR02147 family)
MKSIFEYRDYKAYLHEIERSQTRIQRGFRSRLAEALSCQNAYVSQVLNTEAQFGLEHGLKIAEFLELPEREKKYFLLLIEHARAGTSGLKAYFGRELEALRIENLNLKEKVPEALVLSKEHQAVYYSHWMYSAIHVLTTLKSHRSVKAIVDSLNLPEESVRSAILFLLKAKLLIEKKGELYPGPVQLHLGKDSPWIRQHHTNWRLSAINSLAQIEKNDIHYSTVSSLSYKDVEALKARFAAEIASYVRTVQDSAEETLYGFNLDFYSLIKKG